MSNVYYEPGTYNAAMLMSIYGPFAADGLICEIEERILDACLVEDFYKDFGKHPIEWMNDSGIPITLRVRRRDILRFYSLAIGIMEYGCKIKVILE